MAKIEQLILNEGDVLLVRLPVPGCSDQYDYWSKGVREALAGFPLRVVPSDVDISVVSAAPVVEEPRRPKVEVRKCSDHVGVWGVMINGVLLDWYGHPKGAERLAESLRGALGLTKTGESPTMKVRHVGKMPPMPYPTEEDDCE